MAFCRYCGKEIPDGASCDCAESKAVQQPQNVQQAQSINQPNVVDDCLNDFLGLFINPIECIEEVFSRVNQMTGYIFLIINLLLVFIASSIFIFDVQYMDKNNFLCGIELAAGMGLIKLFMAGVSFITKDVEASFARVFGTFCTITIPSTVLMIVMIIPFIFKVPYANGIVRVTWASLDMLYGYFAFSAMHKNNRSKSIGIYVVAQFVACILFSIMYYYI